MATSFATGNAAGMIRKDSYGYIQGHLFGDTLSTYHVEGGVLTGTEPVFGGVAVSVGLYGDSPDGPPLTFATSNAQIGGFVVSNYLFSAVTEANNDTVPTVSPNDPQGTGVGFVRLGSGVGIFVAIDPTLAETATAATKVDWDSATARLIASADPTKALNVQLAGIYHNSSYVKAEQGKLTWATGPLALIIL